MALPIPRLRDTSNAGIMNAIRNSVGSDYAARITEATQRNMRDTAADIMDYTPARNAFVDALINQIGTVIAHQQVWTNPLAEFKRGMMRFGDTIQETHTGLITAKEYNTDRDYLEKEIFGQEVPHVESAFHRINREDYYKFTVKEHELRRAFLSDTGLHDFVNSIMAAPTTSDEWDEFLLMCSLFAHYEANGGFHRINVPDARAIDAGGDEAKQTIKKVRALAEEMTFMSRKYNAAGMEVAAKRDDLVIFTTPQFNATMDVDALAGAFNMEKSTLAGRQITIPAEQFGLEGAQAILTTKDFFVVQDTLLENRSAPNPVGLYDNYFLHHHSIISHSPFAPAILFHTGVDDTVAYEIKPATGMTDITIYKRDGTTHSGAADRGQILVAHAEATYDGEGDPTITAVAWSLSGNTDPRTRITQHGTIHIGGRETASTLKITGSVVFIDPESPNGDVITKTKNLTVNLDSQSNPTWPVDRPGGPTDYTDPEDPVDPEPDPEPEA